MTVEDVHRVRRSGLVAAACALVAVALGAPVALAQQAPKAAQTAAAPVDPAAVAAKLTGSWSFNKDQSTDTGALKDPDGNTTGRANDPGSSGANRGGSGGGFPGMGGFGGLMGGGRGGMGSGRGGEMGGSRGSTGMTAEQSAALALTTEIRDIPQHLTIAASLATITIAPDDSDPRAFAIHNPKDKNAKEKVDLILARVDVTSRWDGASLVQDFDAGKSMKLEVTYTPSDDGKQLTVKLVATRPKEQGGEAKPLTRVYDRAQ
jgi:hypothetical protein